MLLLVSYLFFTPIERVPAMPVFRGAGSPFLLLRQLTPEGLSRPIAAGCLVTSIGMATFLYFTSKKRKEEAIPPYYRSIANGRKKP